MIYSTSERSLFIEKAVKSCRRKLLRVVFAAARGSIIFCQ